MASGRVRASERVSTSGVLFKCNAMRGGAGCSTSKCSWLLGWPSVLSLIVCGLWHCQGCSQPVVQGGTLVPVAAALRWCGGGGSMAAAPAAEVDTQNWRWV